MVSLLQGWQVTWQGRVRLLTDILGGVLCGLSGDSGSLEWGLQGKGVAMVLDVLGGRGHIGRGRRLGVENGGVTSYLCHLTYHMVDQGW